MGYPAIVPSNMNPGRDCLGYLDLKRKEGLMAPPTNTGPSQLNCARIYLLICTQLTQSISIAGEKRKDTETVNITSKQMKSLFIYDQECDFFSIYFICWFCCLLSRTVAVWCVYFNDFVELKQIFENKQIYLICYFMRFFVVKTLIQ